VLLRLKEDYDGAEPSAGSVSLLNTLSLAHWTNDTGMLERVEQGLGRLGTDVGALARAMPLALSALSAYHAGIGQIVIVGPRDSAQTHALLRTVGSRFLPFAIVLLVEPGAHQSALAERLPFVGPMTLRDGKPTAYVCRNFTCDEPIVDPDELGRRLGDTPV
jgi:uncharacterized protein YyaL (SSP411 family)